MSKEKFGFSTLSRLLGKKNKEKNIIKTHNNTSQDVNNTIINNKGQQYQNQTNNITTTTTTTTTASPPHNNTLSPLHGATTNAPFEQTFRITVLLPREQLYVTRLGARVKLKHLMHLVCENKLLSEEQYEFCDPIDSSQVFDMESTIGTVGLSEIRLCHKNEHKYNNNFNSDEIIKLRNQTSTTTGRSSVTSSEPSSKNSIKIIPKTSPYSSTNSLNSVDSTGLYANYTTPITLPQSTAGSLSQSTTTLTTMTSNVISQNKPPVAPVRKKRVAPRPPSQISITEKEILPPITEWKRPSQISNRSQVSNGSNGSNGSHQQDLNYENSPTINGNGLQRKEFSSSTPNLNATRNGNANLAVYGEIDLHESNRSIDCNGNNQTSQKNYNYTEHHNGKSNFEQNETISRTINSRSMSIQYGNDYDKHYFGSVQNFTTTQITKNYDSGSYLSLDQYPESYQNGKEFPKPSPRRTVNIKKKTVAPPPPAPRTIAPSKLVVTPEETISNPLFETVNCNKKIDVDSKHNFNNAPILLSNGKETSDKISSPTSDLASYDGSQTSEISIENEQSSRTASTLSMASQNTSILEEQTINRKNSSNEQTIPKLPNTEPPMLIKSSANSLGTILIEDEIMNVDETDIIFIPAPSIFADEKVEILNNDIVCSPDIPKVDIAIGKSNDYKHETDLITEAFKDIDDIPDETGDIIEEYKMEEEIIKVDIKPSMKQEIKEDVVTINSDIEDGYQGNKLISQTPIETKKELENSFNHILNEDIETKKVTTAIETQTLPEKSGNEISPVVQHDNILKNINDSKEARTVLDLKNEPYTDYKINNGTVTPNGTFNTSLDSPKTQLPPVEIQTTKSSVEEPPVEIRTKSKQNERLYENRITLKLSNSIISNSNKFRKSIGRSDSFHATRHYENSEFDKENGYGDDGHTDSRSLSFLSLLATRQEIRSQTLYPEQRKLENRKSTSDLTIGELPNLQSLIVMKSILSSQNNLNKLNQNDDNNFNQMKTKGSADIEQDIIEKKHKNNFITSTIMDDSDNNLQKNEDNIPKISSILRTRKNSNELNNCNKDSNYNESSEDESTNTKKWKYQGRPNINLSTWNERPKQTNDVTIKNEGDYIFGGATVKRTSSISSMQRNRMSLPATTFSTSRIQPINYSLDHNGGHKRQSIGDIKLKKVTEEPSNFSTSPTHTLSSTNKHNNYSNNTFPDFRSTLRKSENSAKLYNMNGNKNENQFSLNDQNYNDSKIQLNDNNTDVELSEKSFKEKTKSFGPVVALKTTGLKEQLLLNGQKMPIITTTTTTTTTTAAAANKINENQDKDQKSITNESIKDSNISSINTQREFQMPFKLHINEKALYDNSADNSNSTDCDSRPIIRPFLIKQNMNVNMGKRLSLNQINVNQPITQNTILGVTTPTTPKSAPPIATNTQVSKEDFLAEIRKFNKKELKHI